MAIPKSVRERLHRKLRLTNRGRKTARKAQHDVSMTGRAIPKKSADNDPIPDFRQLKEMFDSLYGASGGRFNSIAESTDDETWRYMLPVINKLILLNMGGWSAADNGSIHESGIKYIGECDADGFIIDSRGRRLNMDVERLHSMKHIAERTARLLDLERKFDLFSGIRNLCHG